MTPDCWEGAQKLRLNYLVDHHDTFFRTVSKQRLGADGAVSLLIAEELKERQRRSTESRLKSAKIGKFKSMSDFDWAWPKSLSKEAIDRLLVLSFIMEPTNVVLVGTSGLGKTMIAKNLAFEAAISGHSVLFIEAAEMMTDLQSQ